MTDEDVSGTVADDRAGALIARYAALGNDLIGNLEKLELLPEIGTAARTSDAALAVLAEALADPAVVDVGACPWSAWCEIVAEKAYDALRPIVARAEHLIVAQLEASLRRGDDARRRTGDVFDMTSVQFRVYAARLLQELPDLAPSTVDVLRRCAEDPAIEVQRAVALTLRSVPHEVAPPA